jgi:hypothetical protein
MHSKNSNARFDIAKSLPKGKSRPVRSPVLIPKAFSEFAALEPCPSESQIDFCELPNGSLVDVVEDPNDANHTLLAIYKAGKIRLADRLEDRGRTLLPIPRSAIGFSDVKLPCGIKPHRPVKDLALDIACLIKYCIDVPDYYLFPLSAFVLYTWVADRLPIAVYLSIIGLPQSGKSTLLELMTLLCRRALLVSDVTTPAAYATCTSFRPTLLIDEIDWRNSRMSSFQQMLRAGTSACARALRVRQSAHSFGPKVLSSLEASPNTALNSRCIQILMAETNKVGLLRKPDDPWVLKFASDLRQELLSFRFANYMSIRPASIPGAEELRPRSRDLFCNLAAPLAGDCDWTRLLLWFFSDLHDKETREPLEPRHEALHAALFQVIHHDPPFPNVRIGGPISLTTVTNMVLKRSGESFAITDKAVGAMLRAMGFRNTHRTNDGWILWLDASTRERCHQLLKTHGNRYIQHSDFVRYSAMCEICKRLASPQASD